VRKKKTVIKAAQAAPARRVPLRYIVGIIVLLVGNKRKVELLLRDFWGVSSVDYKTRNTVTKRMKLESLKIARLEQRLSC